MMARFIVPSLAAALMTARPSDSAIESLPAFQAVRAADLALSVVVLLEDV